MVKVIAAILLLLGSVRAVLAIPLSDLPSQIQDCVVNGPCSSDFRSPVYDFGNMQAYDYSDGVGSGYALRYLLTPPSGQDSGDSGFTPYTGYLWLTVYDSYDLTMDAARVTVYTDKVSPTPANLLIGDSNGLDVAIDMQDAALFSSTGYQEVGLDSDLTSIDQGTMNLLGDQGGDALEPCLAEGCYSRASLNLLYLLYFDNGSGSAILAFYPADTRALFYQLQYYDPYGYDPNTMDTTGTLTRQSYYIATVPLPAALGLFLTGLGLLGLRLRSVRA